MKLPWPAQQQHRQATLEYQTYVVIKQQKGARVQLHKSLKALVIIFKQHMHRQIHNVQQPQVLLGYQH